MNLDDEFRAAVEYIAAYAAAWRRRDGLPSRQVTEPYPLAAERFALAELDQPATLLETIKDLIERAEPGLCGMTSPRFFAWVIGGSHPMGVAADWLTSAWGQNAGSHLVGTAAAAAEAASSVALLELLRLPSESSVGFVTGATMANFTCLAAARDEVQRRAGWDVRGDGLFGAPPIDIIIGADAHTTVFASLKYLGLGDKRVTTVQTDGNGAMLAGAAEAAIKALKGPAIVIAQAGQINTGAFDPYDVIANAAKEVGAWVHVDGAFGLWASAASDRAHLTRGMDKADSWAVDGHKWLQVPYDCGYAIIRDKNAHSRAMQITASYLPGAGDGLRNPSDLAPELSRRARGFSTWAMLRHLGRKGVSDMVSRHCALARRFSERFAKEPDIAIMNDVVLNQVAVRLGTDLDINIADDLTREALARIVSDGVCYVGGAQWRGAWIMRLSVINYATTEADVDRAAEAIIRIWRAVRAEAETSSHDRLPK